MKLARFGACVALAGSIVVGQSGVAAARSLGVAYAEGSVIGAAPGGAPTRAHPSGTLLVSWCEHRREGASVMLGEWSLRAGGWLRRRIIRQPHVCPLVIHLARSGDRVVLVMGGLSEGVEIVSMHDDVELASIALPAGFAPSLDANERHVVVSTFEAQALHVRVLDPTTLTIVSGRMFRGGNPLRPHRVPAIASRAVHLLGGRLYVQVPDDDPHVIAVRLPSLATEIDRRLSVPAGFVTPFSSSVALHRLGEGLAIGENITYVLSLSPKLEVVSARDAVAPEPLPIVVHGKRVVIGPPRDTQSVGSSVPTWQVTVGP